MKTLFTYELTNEQQELLLGVMLSGNYRKREVPYSLWAIEGNGFNATLYQKEKHGKRKFVVQGARAEEFVFFTLEPKVLGDARLGYETILDPKLSAPHAGSDESGKGDYFGPLVVCCAFIEEEIFEKLKELGVRDCKQMSDASVLKVGATLRSLLGKNRFAIVKLNPPAYNRLYAKMKNINRMLAWAHATAIEEILEKNPTCTRVVIDQFARTEETINRALKSRARAVEIEQHHKAESDMAVAVASVIARENFLRDIGDMRKEVFGEAGDEEKKIPIGSSDPRVKELAEEQVLKNGPKWIMNHCKAHFQTTDKVLASCSLTREALPLEGRIVSASLRENLTT